jgi:hypothetical protein
VNDCGQQHQRVDDVIDGSSLAVAAAPITSDAVIVRATIATLNARMSTTPRFCSVEVRLDPPGRALPFHSHMLANLL